MNFVASWLAARKDHVVHHAGSKKMQPDLVPMLVIPVRAKIPVLEQYHIAFAEIGVRIDETPEIPARIRIQVVSVLLGLVAKILDPLLIAPFFRQKPFAIAAARQFAIRQFRFRPSRLLIGRNCGRGCRDMIGVDLLPSYEPVQEIHVLDLSFVP